MNDLFDLYFDWMCNIVLPGDLYSKYSQLMAYLNNVPFEYTLLMDENRAKDGIDLRYRFGYCCGYSNAQICTDLDWRDCSILEMMVALAFRCEEHIMDNPDIGNRTSMWFMQMLHSLELDNQINGYFDSNYVGEHLCRFINRRYEYDGKGGLFTVNNPRNDMRQTEIWYQAMWYLEEVCESE